MAGQTRNKKARLRWDFMVILLEDALSARRESKVGLAAQRARLGILAVLRGATSRADDL